VASGEAVDHLPAGDRAIGLTRDKWLMIVPRELGFGRVRVTPAGGPTAGDPSFPFLTEGDHRG
jgi:hypothetical protein